MPQGFQNMLALNVAARQESQDKFNETIGAGLYSLTNGMFGSRTQASVNQDKTDIIQSIQSNIEAAATTGDEGKFQNALKIAILKLNGIDDQRAKAMATSLLDLYTQISDSLSKDSYSTQVQLQVDKRAEDLLVRKNTPPLVSHWNSNSMVESIQAFLTDSLLEASEGDISKVLTRAQAKVLIQNTLKDKSNIKTQWDGLNEWISTHRDSFVAANVYSKDLSHILLKSNGETPNTTPDIDTSDIDTPLIEIGSNLESLNTSRQQAIAEIELEISDVTNKPTTSIEGGVLKREYLKKLNANIVDIDSSFNTKIDIAKEEIDIAKEEKLQNMFKKRKEVSLILLNIGDKDFHKLSNEDINILIAEIEKAITVGEVADMRVSTFSGTRFLQISGESWYATGPSLLTYATSLISALVAHRD
jgi:hypothetical protein